MSFFRKLRDTLSSSRRDQQGVQNPVFRNNDNDEETWTPIHETEVKRPFPGVPGDSPRPGTSRDIQRNNPQPDAPQEVHRTRPKIEGQQEKTRVSWLKFTLFTVLVLGAITAIIIVVVQLRNLTPPAPQVPVCSDQVEISLMNNLVINCNLHEYISKDVTIKISTPGLFTDGNKSVSLKLGSPANNQIWTMNTTSESSVQIWGPKMQCNSAGIHSINITEGGKSVTNQTVNITISRNLTKVQLKVNRTSSCTSDDYYTDFHVSCSTQSGCEQSSLSFLGAKSELELELPFTCSYNYTNTFGWSTNCSGTIPAEIAGKINSIKCHRSSGQLTEKQQNDVDETNLLEACNLTNRCTTKRIHLGDYLTIVCNLTYVLGSNISVIMYTPSAADGSIILTNQNKTYGGWSMDYTYGEIKSNITLTGPQATCSNAGEYKINITSNATNLPPLQYVTMEINGTLDLNDLNATQLNRSAQCVSSTQCQGSYILRMDQYYLSSTTSFSRNCSTLYSNSKGWNTLCTGRIPMDVQNVSFTVKCTLSDNQGIGITKNVNITL